MLNVDNVRFVYTLHSLCSVDGDYWNRYIDIVSLYPLIYKPDIYMYMHMYELTDLCASMQDGGVAGELETPP